MRTPPDLIAAYDIVADGSDNFATRFLINDACYFAKKTLVSAAVTEFDGQLATFKPHAGEYPCYRCIFPEPPPPGTAPSCSEAGVLGAAAGVMGTLQALEIIKEITGVGETLAGYLLIYEALAARFRKVKVNPDPACPLCGENPSITRYRIIAKRIYPFSSWPPLWRPPISSVQTGVHGWPGLRPAMTCRGQLIR